MPKIKSFFKPHVFLLISAITFVSAFCLSTAINLNNLPNTIKLFVGDEFNLNLPAGLNASINNTAEVSATDTEPLHFNSSADSGFVASSSEVTVSVLGFPFRTLTLEMLHDREVIPWGQTAGIRFQTAGVLVLGTGIVTQHDGSNARPSDGILKPGDVLLEVDGKPLSSKEHLINLVEAVKPGEKLSITLRRENEVLNKAVRPAVSRDDGNNKIGVWVRDGTQGIGTITYFDPETLAFGALGHGITDVDTRKLMPVREGILMEANIMGVRKGKKGNAGELIGDLNPSRVIGEISHNNRLGVFGTVTPSTALPTERMSIALQNDVREGPAIIRAGVNGNEVRDFDIFIERVNRNSSDASKGMVIRITDHDLIAATNGIVQGMSGSPIIQNNRLVGAITHV